MRCACVCVCVYSIVSNSLQPMDSSPPVSSVHGILQARIMERVARPSSRGSSQPRDQTCISCVSCIGRRFFTNCATWGAQNEMLHLHIKFMVWPLLRESRKTHTYTHAHTHVHATCAPTSSNQSNNSSKIVHCGSIINLFIEKTSECLLCANKPKDRSVDEAGVVYEA